MSWGFVAAYSQCISKGGPLIRVGAHLMALPEVDGDRISVNTFANMVRLADSFGVTRITTGDGQTGKLECVTAQAFMATITERVEIGPMVTNGVSRDPGVAAGAVASLDAISNGRAFYVLGRGDAGLRNLGLKQPSPSQLKEYFSAVRDLLRVGLASYQGREMRLRWARPLERVRMYVVAEGPQMLRLAGSIADGVYIGTGLLPEVVEDSVAQVHRGAIEAGRDPSTLDLWWETRFSVASTHDAAFEPMREALASAGNHALRGDYVAKLIPEHLHEPLAEYHRRYSYPAHGTVRREVMPTVPGGVDNADVMDELGLTDYFLDRFGVIGTPDEVVDRLKSVEKHGVGQCHLNAWDETGIRLLGEQVIPRLG